VVTFFNKQNCNRDSSITQYHYKFGTNLAAKATIKASNRSAVVLTIQFQVLKSRRASACRMDAIGDIRPWQWRSYVLSCGCRCTHTKIRKPMTRSIFHHGFGSITRTHKAIAPPQICSSFATGPWPRDGHRCHNLCNTGANKPIRQQTQPEKTTALNDPASKLSR
jgi:hypothetical protein